MDASAPPVLELMQNGLLVTSLKLLSAHGQTQWLIGRSLECDLTINHPTISRKHARVHAEDGGFYLTDLGSTHGTRVAGQPLQPQQPVRLFDALKISLGEHKGELVPANMMAAVMAAMRAAQAAQAAKEQREQDLADADDDGDEAPARPAGGVAASALDDDDEMRAHLPVNFGSKQEIKAQSLEKTHAANARAAAVKLVPKGKKTIKMASNIGASMPAAPAAPAPAPAAAPAVGASQPGRPSAATAASSAGVVVGGGDGGGDAGDADDFVGPPMPPVAAASHHDHDHDMIGPPLPPGVGAAAATAAPTGAADAGEEAMMGPSLPPGLDAAPPGDVDVPGPSHYDPTDLSQQVFGGDDGDGDGDGDDDDDAGRPVQVPVSHQVALKGHGKTVTCLALDPSGSRLVTGSSDHDLYFWDFAGMTQELRPFRHLEEPLGSFQLRSIGYSPSGDRIIVAGASNQPCLFDRDGRKLATLMKGDMYIRDMRSTKGHVAACTAASWHVHDRNLISTASEDGTVRLWDVEVAIERGDDGTSLNVNGGQKTVAVLKDARGIKTGCTAMAWHPEGQTIMCGGRDGSLQLWEFRTSEYKPVILKTNSTPRWEHKAEQVRPLSVARGAHAADCDVSCVKWHRDGHRLASRATDGTLKLWDVRRFDAPLATWGELPALLSMTGCDFSPDGSLLVTGTSVRKGSGEKPQLVFCSTSGAHEVAASVDVDGASVVPLLWHPRLNQIVAGNADGGAYVLYDPSMSEKGVLLCTAKRAPKRAALSYTGGAMQIITPHALPMFREENHDHKKQRSLDRADPLKSRKPEQVMTGPGRGGKIGTTYHHAMMQVLHKDKIEEFKSTDPREALLKYAQVAKDDPKYVTTAYAANQPQVVAGSHLAKAVDSDDEEEDEKK